VPNPSNCSSGIVVYNYQTMGPANNIAFGHSEWVPLIPVLCPIPMMTSSDWPVTPSFFVILFVEELFSGVLCECWWYDACNSILVQIGHLKQGLNPPSFGDLVFVSPYLTIAIKTGIITGVIALAVSIPLIKVKSI
jgi:hypothetical protein